MIRNLAIRRLCWKELRQLLPLVGLLVLVGTVLQIMALLLPFGARLQWRDAAALLGMPGLFAAGVGALLVGQEKEARTLDWLRSLPLPAKNVVGVKLMIGLLGLLLVWIFSVGLGWATGGLTSIQDGKGSEWLWPLHSLFLLLVGYATAWKFRSSMSALLVVVPLACLPLLVASLHQTIVDWPTGRWYIVNREPGVVVMATYLVLFGTGFAWYGWRAGLKYLAPEIVPGAKHETRASADAAALSALNWRRVTPAPALLWQFAVQNRGFLLGLVALQLAAMFFSPPVNVFTTLLVISWLGALVFQSDLPQRRAMFLADRGLSTGLVWITRQILPVFIFVTFLAAAALLADSYVDSQVLQVLDPTVWTMLAVVLLGIYLTTQWLGQVANSPIVSAITAPFLALLIAGYFGYCISELGASWWSVGLALMLPLLATWLGTRDWMDRRSDSRMWIRHTSLAIVFLAMPISSFLVYAATFPHMTAQARRTLQSLTAEDSGLHGYGQLWDLMALPGNEQARQQSAGAQSKVEAIRNKLSQTAYQVKSSEAQYVCIAAALQLRLAEGMAMPDSRASVAENETDSLVGNSAEYRDWITLLLDIHDRLRQSWRLLEHDQADVIEMWLVEELKANGAKMRLGDNLLRRLQAMFGNSGERDTARRRAVALSWKHQGDQELGGYSLHNQRAGHITTKQVWTANRAADVISELLLKELQGSDGKQSEANQPSQSQRQIAALLGRPAMTGREVYVQNSAGERQLLYFETMLNFIPGCYWNGTWEREGAELSVSLSK